MPEPVWIAKDTLLALHERSLALHGGAPGLRDEGLLESALARPRNLFMYESEADLARLAGTYAVGVASNHPFVDGNKRAALTSMLVFLAMNGERLAADRVEATRMIFAVAAGDVDIPQLAAWIRANLA